jgi:hypothetical protein
LLKEYEEADRRFMEAWRNLAPSLGRVARGTGPQASDDTFDEFNAAHEALEEIKRKMAGVVRKAFPNAR